MPSFLLQSKIPSFLVSGILAFHLYLLPSPLVTRLLISDIVHFLTVQVVWGRKQRWALSDLASCSLAVPQRLPCPLCQDFVSCHDVSPKLGYNTLPHLSAQCRTNSLAECRSSFVGPMSYHLVGPLLFYINWPPVVL